MEQNWTQLAPKSGSSHSLLICAADFHFPLPNAVQQTSCSFPSYSDPHHIITTALLLRGQVFHLSFPVSISLFCFAPCNLPINLFGGSWMAGYQHCLKWRHGNRFYDFKDFKHLDSGAPSFCWPLFSLGEFLLMLELGHLSLMFFIFGCEHPWIRRIGLVGKTT